MRRALIAVAVLVTAVVLQVDVVNRLHLPLGHPDLVVVCVVALALAGGPGYGVAVGFAAGLLVDIVPPADHTIGRMALAGALVGYAAGLLEDAEERSVLATVATVAGASALAVVLYAGIGALVGDARITGSAVGRSLAATVAYDVVLAPFLVPLVSGVLRRAEPTTAY